MKETTEIRKITKEMSNEEKSVIRKENFIRICQPRVNKALKAIELISNCSNKSQYEYTEEQIAAIEVALENMVEQTIKAFKPKAETKTEFTF